MSPRKRRHVKKAFPNVLWWQIAECPCQGRATTVRSGSEARAQKRQCRVLNEFLLHLEGQQRRARVETVFADFVFTDVLSVCSDFSQETLFCIVKQNAFLQLVVITGKAFFSTLELEKKRVCCSSRKWRVGCTSV